MKVDLVFSLASQKGYVEVLTPSDKGHGKLFLFTPAGGLMRLTGADWGGDLAQPSVGDSSKGSAKAIRGIDRTGRRTYRRGQTFSSDASLQRWGFGEGF